ILKRRPSARTAPAFSGTTESFIFCFSMEIMAFKARFASAGFSKTNSSVSLPVGNGELEILKRLYGRSDAAACERRLSLLRPKRELGMVKNRISGLRARRKVLQGAHPGLR